MTDSTYGPHTEAWRRLGQVAARLAETSVSDLFAADQDRFGQFSCAAQGLLLDFSRQRIDQEVLTGLLDLAEQAGVSSWIERMYSGFPVNNTEDRAALHIALRRPASQPVCVDGEDVMPAVEAERQKIRALADALHAGELKGATGKPITDVVNIGIGGSDLGIMMAVHALSEHRQAGVRVHCVSNIDGVALTHVLGELDPAATLFVVCSKTFTTLETLTNATAARAWLVRQLGKAAVAAHFVAVSTNDAAMDAFGIAADRRLRIWDWVGGRYSLWSAVGLTIALAIGAENFDRLLNGAHHMDAHFETAVPEQNLPLLLALVGIWNRNFLGIPSHAVLPYDDHLARLPAYLQQLEMESNGKSVRRNGLPVESATCPVIWGEPGSNAQHSFYQLLHQGTDPVSVDFLLPAKSLVGLQDQQDLAAANCLAQSWALAAGDQAAVGSEPAAGAGDGPGAGAGAANDAKDFPARDPHREYPGSRPNTLILFEQLDPGTLGRLIALYEHKVFVQGVIWDVNPFDQWGVELGKKLASVLADARTAKQRAPGMIRGVIASLQALKSGRSG